MNANRAVSEIAKIWAPAAQHDRWHRLWILSLEQQARSNPRHPGNSTTGEAAVLSDLDRYRHAAAHAQQQPDEHLRRHWDSLQRTRHELVADLAVLNREAGAQTAHLGLTSSDITDLGNQIAIHDSLHWVRDAAWHIAQRLADHAEQWAGLRIAARTHGQRAQITTLGHRYATILGPLVDWLDRADEVIERYPLRPQHGAVGTAADLQRVLNGWKPADAGDKTAEEIAGKASETGLGATGSASDPPAGADTPAERVESSSTPWSAEINANAMAVADYQDRIAVKLGFGRHMATTRQVYHRSYDLPVAGLMVELASLAQTWATDRRLEAMMDLGREGFGPGQVGSSAMAHKSNPRISERLCALAVVTRSHYTAMAELAGMEWLEGDVSTSAARRIVLPALFENIETILCNWAWVIDHWAPDPVALSREVDDVERHQQFWSGLYLQVLIESGMGREQAHETLREIYQRHTGVVARVAQAAGIDSQVLLRRKAEEQNAPIGTIRHQIRRLVTYVRTRKPVDLEPWQPEVKW